MPYIEKQSHSTQSVNHFFKGEREQASRQTSKRARASKHNKHKDEMQKKNRAYAKPVL